MAVLKQLPWACVEILPSLPFLAACCWGAAAASSCSGWCPICRSTFMAFARSFSTPAFTVLSGALRCLSSWMCGTQGSRKTASMSEGRSVRLQKSNGFAKTSVVKVQETSPSSGMDSLLEAMVMQGGSAVRHTAAQLLGLPLAVPAKIGPQR
eukprot:scaffold208846_cov23-Tisochrysis_lutea.AAC.1